MKLPAELVLAKRIRAQRKVCKRGAWTQPITGAYCVASRDRRHEELAAITAKT